MGYTTEFIGKFTFNREPSQELKDYINCFAKTRHVKRDVEAIQKIFPDWEKRAWKGKLGREAEFFLQPYNEVNYQSDDRLDMTGFYQRNGIVDDNYPPESQPSLWCHWIINKHGELVWSGAEKFYEYVEWLEYLIRYFFEPEGIVLSGKCFYSGERMSDWGYICVENNRVEKIPSDIVVTSPKEDMICVRMPEVVKDELEKIVAYKHGISLEQALQRFMVWCVEEPENFTFWHKNAMAKSDDYEKRNEFIKVMIEELDKAYGDRALMAGIRFGVDEFCKRFDVDEKYKKRIEEIKRR